MPVSRVSRKNVFTLCLVLVMPLFQACSEKEAGLDEKLQGLINENALDTDFSYDLPPTEKQLEVELGGDLFYSSDLSLDGSITCASCHHPRHGGADGTSLPIGIGGGGPDLVGQERIKFANVNGNQALHGLVPRNSPTVFNTSLYRKNMFWDGRVGYVENNGTSFIKTGFGYSLFSPIEYEENSLLQAQARMPLSSPFEMKGGLYPEKNNHEIEDSIIKHLASQEYWCERFRKVFPAGEKQCSELVTIDKLSYLLAIYQASLVYVNSPFEMYLKGDKDAISPKQKEGAILFLSGKESGGYGCVACHSGKIFSNESFYNLNIPASGVGKNTKGYDFGRHNVHKSAPRFSFKAPSLLNIELTSPYMHNGIAKSLTEAILYHQQNYKPESVSRVEVQGYDYGVIDAYIGEVYKKQEGTLALLPQKIKSEDLEKLEVFLSSLTDECLQNSLCWSSLVREDISHERQVVEPKSLSEVVKLKNTDTQKPTISCQLNNDQTKSEKGLFFTYQDVDVGLKTGRALGKIKKGWLIDVLNNGGMSSMDLDYDCLDDLVIDHGQNGIIVYKQESSGMFSEMLKLDNKSYINPLLVDANGDYKIDLWLGSLGQVKPKIIFDILGEKNEYKLTSLSGPVVNASFADIDNDSDLDMTLAFWRSYTSMSQPHIWINDSNANFSPKENKFLVRGFEDESPLTESPLFMLGVHGATTGGIDLTFTPNFVDIDKDGDQDLLMASDFGRSQVLENDKGLFVDITNKAVIDDDNGMGVAIADFQRNGYMDWYVTSIFTADVGDQTGNRFYRNLGFGKFEKMPGFEPLKDQEWAWAACARDFDNDGYEDIFYISGWGEQLSTASYENEEQKESSERFIESNKSYSVRSPRLLLNDQKGSFELVSEKAGLGESFPARSIACFDYEQDGDIDIVVNPLEGLPRLYKNHLDGSKNWLSVRLIGSFGNTEAFGAKVELHTSEGVQYREVRFENNYISRNPAQLHFGLGELYKVQKLVVRFPQPDARTIELDSPQINQLHIISVN